MIEVRSVVIRKSMAAIDKDAHADSISAQFSGYINPNQKEKKKKYVALLEMSLFRHRFYFSCIYSTEKEDKYTRMEALIVIKVDWAKKSSGQKKNILRATSHTSIGNFSFSNCPSGN